MPSLHSEGLATPPTFIKAGENGGQWFSHLANLKDGSAPPADAPGWMMNVGGGNLYDLGSYDESTENFTTIVQGVNIDHGKKDFYITFFLSACTHFSKTPCTCSKSLMDWSVTVACW